MKRFLKSRVFLLLLLTGSVSANCVFVYKNRSGGEDVVTGGNVPIYIQTLMMLQNKQYEQAIEELEYLVDQAVDQAVDSGDTEDQKNFVFSCVSAYRQVYPRVVNTNAMLVRHWESQSEVLNERNWFARRASRALSQWGDQ